MNFMINPNYNYKSKSDIQKQLYEKKKVKQIKKDDLEDEDDNVKFQIFKVLS